MKAATSDAIRWGTVQSDIGDHNSVGTLTDSGGCRAATGSGFIEICHCLRSMPRTDEFRPAGPRPRGGGSLARGRRPDPFGRCLPARGNRRPGPREPEKKVGETSMPRRVNSELLLVGSLPAESTE